MDEAEKQLLYRDARVTGKYDEIWQSTGKCVFCDLKDKYIVYEESGVVLTVAVFAYTDGHMMIIPRRHVTSVKELTADEWETMRKLMYLAKKMIRKTHNIKGMQIVQKDGASAQSTVGHIHFHCIPFDDPGLSTWNYHQLQHTPVENADLYKKFADDTAKLAKRFSSKYQDS